MKRLNKKGFTLIELLAVIIILGVLLLIAVPAMNGVIEKSKKDAFVSNGKSYIGAVRYSFIQGEYAYPSAGSATVVFVKELPLDQGAKGKSPYDSVMRPGQTYVVVYNSGTSEKDNFQYFFGGSDEGNNCIPLTEENSIKAEVVKARNTACTGEPVSLTSTSTEISINGVNIPISKIYSEYMG